MITVTSAEVDGRLAPGSNWGRRTVDLLTPGERIPIIDFRGRATEASGTSYAVARIAAAVA